jgi:hypothetical protein
VLGCAWRTADQYDALCVGLRCCGSVCVCSDTRMTVELVGALGSWPDRCRRVD